MKPLFTSESMIYAAIACTITSPFSVPTSIIQPTGAVLLNPETKNVDYVIRRGHDRQDVNG